jgi:PAS domain S-box-containing protein
LLTRYTQLVRSGSLRAYAAATALALLGVLLRVALAPVVGDQVPYVTIFPVVLLAAVIGGARAGILALVISAVLSWYLVLPEHGAFRPGGAELLGFVLFLAVAALMIAAAQTLRNAAERAATQQEQLAAALAASSTGTWRWNIPADQVQWDEAMCKVYGVAPERAPRTSSAFFDLVLREDQAHAREVIGRAMTSGGSVEYEFRIRLPDGRVRWIYDRSRVIFDPEGRPAQMIGACIDVTERKQADETLRLHSMLLHNMSEGVSLATEDGVIVYVNPAEEQLFGYERGELVGQHVSVQNAYPPEENARVVADVIATLRESGTWSGEWRNRRKDGSEFVTASQITTVEVGGRRHWLCVQRDVTERHLAQQRQQLLINELNHRVKNTLATVQSLAAQTARNAPSVAAFREAFEARLLALSATHSLLTDSLWRSAPLEKVLRAELEPYRGADAERVTLAGDAVELTPSQALGLGLACHELATNAAKYGALGRPDGRLSVTWAAAPQDGSGDVLRIDWRESTPGEVRPPTRRGFGTRLIERTIVSDLAGAVEMRFAPTGLECCIEIPLRVPSRGVAGPTDDERSPSWE